MKERKKNLRKTSMTAAKGCSRSRCCYRVNMFLIFSVFGLMACDTVLCLNKTEAVGTRDHNVTCRSYEGHVWPVSYNSTPVFVCSFLL